MTKSLLFLSGAAIISSLFVASAVLSNPVEARMAPPLINMEVDSSITLTCPSLTRGLARGMRDSGPSGDVRNLQTFFATHYKMNPADMVTGYFGPITEGLVKRFQRDHGISAIGYVGPLTRAVLAAECQALVKDKVGLEITAPNSAVRYHFGDGININWRTTNAPTNAGMFVQLSSAGTGEVIKSVIVPYASSTFLLGTKDFCNGNFSDGIFGSCENLSELLKNGQTLVKIQAALYTPKDSCFGFCASTSSIAILAKAESAPFTISEAAAKYLTATNTSGRAPLKTAFSIHEEGEYTLDFGDGRTEAVSVPGIRCITTPCTTPAKVVTHTYRTPGTYTAVLTQIVKNTCDTSTGMVCAAWYSREEVVGTITIEFTKN